MFRGLPRPIRKRRTIMKRITNLKKKPILIFVRLLGALLLVALALAPKAALAGRGPQHLFYTLGGPNPATLYAIQLSGSKVTTTKIGDGAGGGCASLAMSPSTGKLYSMCVHDPSKFPNDPMYLVTIDTNSGVATFPPSGTKNNTGIMAMAFAPEGTLYAVGGCVPHPDPPAEGGSFDCDPGAPG